MTLWQDVRFGARLLVKDRWFTLAAATALALGIGANAAVFTFVNAVLVRGLPFHEPERIMSVWTEDDRGRQRSTSELDFEDWRTESRTFSDLAAFLGAPINVSDEGRAPERFQGTYVTANLFGLIGQPPAIGRDFTPEDDQPGAEPVTILGHRVWQNRYDSDPTVLGRTLKANSKVVTVIGVMPTDMRFPFNTDIWIPRAQLPPETFNGQRDRRLLQVIGRLGEETSVEQARVELASIGQRLALTYPATNENLTPNLMPFNEQASGGEIRLIFLALQGAVAFVLLIACANVASLLLARSAHRTQEISVRVALGASRWRVVRQLLVESVMLALIAGIGGFGLAAAGVRWFDAATQNVGKPYWMEFTMDGTVFAFMAAVCLATGIIFGLAPALHVSKTDVNEVLKEGGRGGTGGLRVRRWTRALIVAEIALTIVLLAGAGFMMRSFLTLYRMDLGVDTSQLLTMRLYLPLTKYPELGPRTELFRQFEERLAGINEIEASTLTTNTPLGFGPVRPLAIDGRPPPVEEEPPDVTMLSVSDGYFDALGVQLLRGRAFTTADGRPGQESAIVNRRFVSMHFADEDPIGRRIKMLASPNPVPGSPEPTWLTIVGVSPDIRQRAMQDPEPDPVVYVPHRIESPRASVLILRTRGDPADVTALIRDTMRVLEPDLPLFNIQTMDALLAEQRWMFRTFGSMFATFALIALLLSAVGLYAVTAYSVTQRTQELGLRVALGAQPGQVLWLVLRQGLMQLAIGLPIGLAGAFGVGRLLQSVLVQTSPTDPVTLVSIVAVLVGAAMLACLWPARRAAHLDPSAALRYE